LQNSDLIPELPPASCPAAGKQKTPHPGKGRGACALAVPPCLVWRWK